MEASTECVVAAVDDHEIVLGGVAKLFEKSAKNIRLVAVEASVSALLDGPGRAADVVLLDLLLPGEPDVAANVRRVRESGPQVVVFTSDSRPALVRAAVDAGALGVVLKADPPECVEEAVLAAKDGEFTVSSSLAHALVNDPRAGIRLSERQREVLTLVARGMPHKSIAKRLGIKVGTVPSHLRRVAAAYARVGAPLALPELAHQALVDGHIELRRDDGGW